MDARGQLGQDVDLDAHIEGDDIWTSLAGPTALGRSVFLAPGVAPPHPWASSARILLNRASLANPETLHAVRRAYLRREPVVYEIDPALEIPERGTDEREVWDVPPEADFVAEATWRLARANAVDARDFTNPRWPLCAMALAAGATRGRGVDVVLPDGSVAWLDGGPLHLWPQGDERFGDAVVVPRIALTRGLLTPVAAQPPTAALAPDQLAAVADPSTRARIIAPAGSGKTRVLTERARHVLDSGAPADSLLLVAFNKRAQEEMRERTSDHPTLQIQTLNALALSILNGTNGFVSRGMRVQTISERDVRTIIAGYVKFPRKTNTDPCAAWIDALTEVRLGLRSPTVVEDDYQGDLEGFADFFPQYRQHLADHRQVDFDEQIYLAIEVMLRDPQVRLTAERRAQVLLVDEFQDLTPAHMLLLRLLAGPSLSIFAVGDDDQTIYGFSGATPEWLVEFENHVPDAVHHALEVNYRCPAPVVHAASNLLTHNTVRVAKVIRPGPTNVLGPNSLSVVKADDQVQHVTKHIRALLDAGAAPSEIAVLSRVNANLVPVQVALVEAGIPVSVRDGGEFLRGSGVESALAWLRLAVRPERLAGEDIGLAVRRPGRGIAPRVREWMGEQDSSDGLTRLAGRLDAAASAKITDFVRDLDRVTAFAQQATTSTLIEFVRSVIGLDKALATLDGSHQGRNSPSSSDGLRSLIALGRQHTDPTTFDSWLKKSLSTLSDTSGVTLATVHRVKGLEWPHVVVYDASFTVFPHRLSVDVEEERRVFHVALTRCADSLLVTAEADSPSIFLDELDAPATAPAREVRESIQRDSNADVRGTNPVTAEVGLEFKWGGYEFTVREVNPDGMVVSTGDSRTTVLPFGWTITVGGRARTLVGPSVAKSRRAAAGPARQVDADLYNALKSWRLEQSRADNVPAYVIFNDRTLEEISSVRPHTVGELLGINGIGPSKVDRYGDQILALTLTEPTVVNMAGGLIDTGAASED
jgi:DNA helicase-2/ATP-dependent DNA helicase PcrA